MQRRFAKFKAKNHTSTPKFELWINEGGGLLRNPDGRTMTRQDFDTAFPDATKFTLDIFNEPLKP
jgi:hypothetical protein